MEKIKSLANQLRDEMVKSGEKKSAGSSETKGGGTKRSKPGRQPGQELLDAIIAYDNIDHKSMVHVRFDKNTVDLMNKFKMATNVDVTRFVVFAVKRFLESTPEVRAIIKHYIQNTPL